jgi:signal transduction histidine kinase
MMMRQKKRLILGVLLSIIVGNTILMLFIVALLDKQASDQLRMLRVDKENAIIKELKGRVESAHSLIRHFAKTHKDQQVAQQKSMDAVASIHFGQNNYIWIHRLNPNKKESAEILVHPDKSLENQKHTNLIDLDIISSIYYQGKVYNKSDSEVSHIRPTNIFEKFNNKCLREGKGVVAYYWPNLLEDQTGTVGFLKISYVKYFSDWRWVIGAGSYADHIDKLISTKTNRVNNYKKYIFKQSILIMSFVSGLILIFVFIQIKSSLRSQKKAENALLEAKVAAEKSNNAKNEFLANISHEIRTPMNCIMGMTSLLLNTELQASQRKYLEMTKTSTNRLLLVINEILDFSRIEKGNVALAKTIFKIHDVLNELLIIMEVEAQTKGLQLYISISPDVPETLSGDVDRLQQILINILGNAIKFTEHGSVKIKVSLQQLIPPSSARLYFQVIDTGIGIPSSKHKTIFQSFSQVDTSYSRKQSGTGLGLAVSTILVKLLGGKIGVTSCPGKGSTFWFSAEFTLVENVEVCHQKTSPSPSLPVTSLDNLFKDKKILVADDEVLNRVLVRTLLEEKKIHVTEAANGIEVLKIIEKNSFDLILMDIQMPELDGIATTKQIRTYETTEGKYTPILALTAHALETDKQKCLNGGMDDYISKPIDMEIFFTTMANHL